MNNEDCLFCKIIDKKIPSNVVYEDETVLAFHDINPVAPVHVLIVPKVHICCANAVNEANKDAISDVFWAVAKIAKQLKIDQNGYRIINNCGLDGGQTVMHLHYHLIAGLSLGEKLI